MNQVLIAMKRIGASFGLDISRMANNPNHTLLGIRNQPFKTIIDIGANTGQSAKKYRQLFPDAKIYCFEPLPDMYGMLDSWAKSQNGMVETFNYALGEQSGVVDFIQHVDHPSSSSILETTQTTIDLFPNLAKQARVQVSLKRLDDFSDILHLEKDVLVKIDVQGFERQVILGGKEILKQTEACIVEVNISELYDGQSGFKELLILLEEFGFSYGGNLAQSYDSQGACLFFDAIFVKTKRILS